MDKIETIDQHNRRWGELKNERSSWLTHWQLIGKYLLPRSGRFLITDANKGDTARYNSIYDSTATRALRTLAAGMMSGMTSPARPWFRLTTSDPKLDESTAVKTWLTSVTTLMQMIFAKSNTYRTLHTMYGELGGFGTAADIFLPDFKNVVHHYPLTVGEYAISTDHYGRVNTLYREWQTKVSCLVEEFGYANCSKTVQSLHDQKRYDAPVTIRHAIEPRYERDAKMKDAKNMPYKSNYFEVGGDNDKFLRESGFKTFRAMAPRWDVIGGDIYGNCPGMEALGDIKQLQHQQLRKAEGIDYKVRPPLQVPTSMKEREIDTLPGGVSFVDNPSASNAMRTAFDVNLDLSHLLEDIHDVRDRIESTFYVPMFMMLNNNNDTRMTATEVAERHEEKLLMIGPVLERLHNEILDPLIEMTFERMLEAGIVPPAPPEMQGMELNVEFVSMLAQAQRAIATNSVDRYVLNLGNIAAVKPDILDKFDSDYWADSYADMLGVDPQMVVPSDKVALIRKARAEAAQAAQQQEQINQAADSANKLGSIDTSNPNALTDITRAFSGYT